MSSANNKSDKGLMDPEFPSQRLLGDSASGVSEANIENLNLVQFGLFVGAPAQNTFRKLVRPNIISPQADVSSLGGFVSVVVRASSKEKMFGSNASSVIASMKNAHSIRNRSIFKNVGNSVCSEVFPIDLNSSVAVSVVVSTTCPNPAIFQSLNMSGSGSIFVNSCPKSSDMFWRN